MPETIEIEVVFSGLKYIAISPTFTPGLNEEKITVDVAAPIDHDDATGAVEGGVTYRKRVSVHAPLPPSNDVLKHTNPSVAEPALLNTYGS
jgi:hypothetical protein